jgi:hypothetical protein
MLVFDEEGISVGKAQIYPQSVMKISSGVFQAHLIYRGIFVASWPT